MDKSLLISLVVLCALASGALSEDKKSVRTKKEDGGSIDATFGDSITPAPENILHSQPTLAGHQNPLFSANQGSYKQSGTYYGAQGYKSYSSSGADDGSYKPQLYDHGQYVHDNTGNYIHQNNPYVHDGKPYEHDANPYFHSGGQYQSGGQSGGAYSGKFYQNAHGALSNHGKFQQSAYSTPSNDGTYHYKAYEYSTSQNTPGYKAGLTGIHFPYGSGYYAENSQTKFGQYPGFTGYNYGQSLNTNYQSSSGSAKLSNPVASYGTTSIIGASGQSGSAQSVADKISSTDVSSSSSQSGQTGSSGISSGGVIKSTETYTGKYQTASPFQTYSYPGYVNGYQTGSSFGGYGYKNYVSPTYNQASYQSYVSPSVTPTTSSFSTSKTAASSASSKNAGSAGSVSGLALKSDFGKIKTQPQTFYSEYYQSGSYDNGANKPDSFGTYQGQNAYKFSTAAPVAPVKSSSSSSSSSSTYSSSLKSSAFPTISSSSTSAGKFPYKTGTAYTSGSVTPQVYGSEYYQSSLYNNGAYKPDSFGTYQGQNAYKFSTAAPVAPVKSSSSSSSSSSTYSSSLKSSAFPTTSSISTSVGKFPYKTGTAYTSGSITPQAYGSYDYQAYNYQGHPGHYQTGSLDGAYKTSSYNAYQYPNFNTQYQFPQTSGVYGQNIQYTSNAYQKPSSLYSTGSSSTSSSSLSSGSSTSSSTGTGSSLSSGISSLRISSPGASVASGENTFGTSSLTSSSKEFSSASGKVNTQPSYSGAYDFSSYGKKVVGPASPVTVITTLKQTPTSNYHGYQSGYYSGSYQQPQLAGAFNDGKYASGGYYGVAPPCHLAAHQHPGFFDPAAVHSGANYQTGYNYNAYQHPSSIGYSVTPNSFISTISDVHPTVTPATVEVSTIQQ